MINGVCCCMFCGVSQHVDLVAARDAFAGYLLHGYGVFLLHVSGYGQPSSTATRR
jgi:hypothetical protein